MYGKAPLLLLNLLTSSDRAENTEACFFFSITWIGKGYSINCGNYHGDNNILVTSVTKESRFTLNYNCGSLILAKFSMHFCRKKKKRVLIFLQWSVWTKGIIAFNIKC